MRRFLLLAHRVPVDGAFTLNDLAGGAGRMDEVARVVSTALTLSNDLRRDTMVTILFTAGAPAPARRIDVDGRRVRYLNPDERSTAALLKNALVRAVRTERPTEASPGLVVAPAELEPTLREFATLPGAFWLREDGLPLRAWQAPADSFAAVLGDSTDPNDAERALLVATGLPTISVGPRVLRASQCVDVVQNEFDVRWGGPSPSPASAPGGLSVEP